MTRQRQKLPNICTTSAQCLRRWSNIVQILYKCFVHFYWCIIDSLIVYRYGWHAAVQVFEMSRFLYEHARPDRMLQHLLPRAELVPEITTRWASEQESATRLEDVHRKMRREPETARHKLLRTVHGEKRLLLRSFRFLPAIRNPPFYSVLYTMVQISAFNKLYQDLSKNICFQRWIVPQTWHIILAVFNWYTIAPHTERIRESIHPIKAEFTIVIFIHYKPPIAVSILDL